MNNFFEKVLIEYRSRGFLAIFKRVKPYLRYHLKERFDILYGELNLDEELKSYEFDRKVSTRLLKKDEIPLIKKYFFSVIITKGTSNCCLPIYFSIRIQLH